MSNLFKKFAVGLSTIAMVSTMFVAPTANAAAPGEVYKTPDGTVWFVTSDMQKRPFTSGGAFLSYGFLSFSQVKDADASVIALPTGSFIAPQDGRIFCATETKGTDVKGECSLITGGMKSAFTSSSVFTGNGFSFARAFYGDSSFLTKTTDTANTTDAHRPGVLVNNSGTVQLVVNGGLWGVPSLDVFNSWGWSFSDVVPANSADKAMAQIGVIPGRVAGQLVPTATTTPTPSGSYSASVASDSPAASTLVAGQALATLANFTVTGSGTVTSLKFKRTGVSADATLSNVYLFEGANRITDSASVSSGYITFAGLNWSVSGSRNVSIRSDIASGTSGQTVGAQLAAVNGSDLSVMPSGATHTIATASLATVAVASASGTFTDPGTDITVWQSTVTVGTRDTTLNRLSLRQIGSIQSADIKNFRLLVDGVQVASQASLDSNGYVTFSPSSLFKSGSRTVRVMADVTGGSGRTVQMSLRGAFDISTTDSQYNVGVLATGTFPFGPSASTVAAGTLSVAKATDSPSTNLVACASDVVLGKWTFNAYGEAVKVETLTVGVDSNGTDANLTLRNGRVFVDGSQVGSTTDIAAVNVAATGQSFTTNFTVTPGTARTVEVRADMFDSEGTEEICGTNTFTSVQAALVAGSSNGIPQVSLTPINVPTANVNANALTIATGSIALAANPTYPAQSMSAPQTNYKIGSFILSGNSSEAVNLNTFTLDMTVTDNAGADVATVADVTDVYLKYGTSQTNIKPTISATGNTYSVNTQLPVNGSMQIDVYGNIGSDFTATDTVLSRLLVSGTTVNSSTAVSTNSGGVLSGQTITDAAGSITATEDASSPVAQLVDDSGTVTTGAFKFAALTDSYTITDITVDVAAVTAVSTITIKDGGTTVASKPGATSVAFSGLNIAVAANTNKVLTVELTMSTIGVGGGTSDSDITTSISAFTARNSSGTSATGTGTPSANAMYAYKAIPTVSALSLPTSELAGGIRTLAKFSVSSTGTGTIAWKQAMFEITKAAAPTISSVTLHNSDTGEQITAAFIFNNETVDATNTVCGADATSCELLISVGTNADDNVVELVSGAKNYEVRATIAGTLAAGNFISTVLDRNTTSHTGKGIYTAVDNAGAGAANPNDASFIWSDESNAATSDTGVAVWNDDYLVKNLPISWTLNRS